MANDHLTGFKGKAPTASLLPSHKTEIIQDTGISQMILRDREGLLEEAGEEGEEAEVGSTIPSVGPIEIRPMKAMRRESGTVIGILEIGQRIEAVLKGGVTDLDLDLDPSRSMKGKKRGKSR